MADHTADRALVFGQVPDLYDRARPSYPDALIDDILEATPKGGRVLEVGAGTGIATSLLVARGLDVVAVEPDSRMARVARAKFVENANVHITVSRFEDWEGEHGSFDLIVSAQAWHWIDPAVGFAHAHELLKPDGHLALFWNRPRPEDTDWPGSIDAAYARHAPELAERSGLQKNRTLDHRRRQTIESGMFEKPDVRRYDWNRVYATGEYLALLQTHSDHRILGERRLAHLLDDIETAIDAAGGHITLPYTTELHLTRPIPKTRNDHPGNEEFTKRHDTRTGQT